MGNSKNRIRSLKNWMGAGSATIRFFGGVRFSGFSSILLLRQKIGPQEKIGFPKKSDLGKAGRGGRGDKGGNPRKPCKLSIPKWALIFRLPNCVSTFAPKSNFILQRVAPKPFFNIQLSSLNCQINF